MEENKWTSLYCIQLYEPTESDSGLRHLIKNDSTNEIYEEKIKITEIQSINGKYHNIEYYDRIPIK